MDPTYPLVPIANFAACALAIIPLFYMVKRSWNTGVYAFVLWLFLSSLSFAVNTIIWSSDVKDKAPVWCDISSHIQLLASIGGPACSLIITRRLYKITRLRGATVSKRQRHIELSIELVICIAIPIFVTGLFYINQGVRYKIVEELGCTYAADNSGVYILLVVSWNLVFPGVSLIFYTPRIIYTFYRNRREMNEFLDSGDDGLSQSHLYRMLILGCFDIFVTLPISIVTLVVSLVSTRPFQFYEGWAFVHSDWEPAPIPKSAWSLEKIDVFSVHWDEWLNPFLALVFFALFGLTEEAKRGYLKFFRSFGRPFGTAQVVRTEDVLPDAVFKSGGGASATAMSNISVPSSTQADAMA